jgi:hypothetical protein
MSDGDQVAIWYATSFSVSSMPPLSPHPVSKGISKWLPSPIWPPSFRRIQITLAKHMSSNQQLTQLSSILIHTPHSHTKTTRHIHKHVLQLEQQPPPPRQLLCH